MQNPMHSIQLALRQFKGSLSSFAKLGALFMAVSFCSGCSWMAMDDERVGVDVQKVQLGQKASLIIPGDQLFYEKTANLKPKAFDVLESIAASLQAQNVRTFSVTGYVNNMSSQALNDQVSSKQAEVLMAYLWKHMTGIVWVKFEGKGAKDPITASKSPSVSSQNRRITIAYQDRSNEVSESSRMLY